MAVMCSETCISADRIFCCCCCCYLYEIVPFLEKTCLYPKGGNTLHLNIYLQVPACCVLCTYRKGKSIYMLYVSPSAAAKKNPHYNFKSLPSPSAAAKTKKLTL